MKRGQVIHKELELEMHETVEFTAVTSAEEFWALRLLGIISQVETLRATGFTVYPRSSVWTDCRENSLFLDTSRIIR
jgi:Exonuclease V - a 5' deoxyribonuclease